MTRETFVFGLLILFVVKGLVLITLALSSWKDRIVFWLVILALGLGFAAAYFWGRS